MMGSLVFYFRKPRLGSKFPDSKPVLPYSLSNLEKPLTSPSTRVSHDTKYGEHIHHQKR